MEFQKAVLDNGLTVIGERNPSAKSLALGYIARTGSRDETPEVSGVSHFLEHMMFKGSDELSAKAINLEFDVIGAKYNAYTSNEVTTYHGAVLPEHQGRLLALLTRMMRPALRLEDFEVEKKVILEEIQMYEDRPTFRVFDEVQPRFYRGHPLGNSVLGSTASITELSRDHMAEYFSRRYAPDNLLLAMAGNYDWDAVLDTVTGLSAAWTPAGAGRERPAFSPEASVSVIESSKFNRVHMALMAPGYATQDERRHAAGVLGVILGDDEGSRLYWALVDSGLADSASIGHDDEDGLGHFGGYASSDPERAQEVLDTFRRVLHEAQAGGVTAEELARAKRKVAVSLVLRAETPYGRLFPLGLEYLDSGHYRSLADTVKLVQSIRLEDVNGVLGDRPFDALTVVGLGPIKTLA